MVNVKLMSAKDGDAVKLIRPEGEIAAWSDLCHECNHTRADHLVHPEAFKSMHAISDCNTDGCDCEVFRLD